MQAERTGDPDSAKREARLYLLFDRGARPSREQLLAALSQIYDVSISHDPALGCAGATANGTPSGYGCDWLELLQWGMTFDLVGIAPGPGVKQPEIAYRYGCPADLDAAAMDAMVLLAGPHVAGGAHALPVLRAMFDLGRELTRVSHGVRAIVWGPARSAIAVPQFTRTVGEWLDSGAFPALGMIGFAPGKDGGLASEGLDFLIGAELMIDPALANDRVSASRLAARLVHELAAAGGLDTDTQKLIQDGQRILLTHGEGGRIVKVMPM